MAELKSLRSAAARAFLLGICASIATPILLYSRVPISLDVSWRGTIAVGLVILIGCVSYWFAALRHRKSAASEMSDADTLDLNEAFSPTWGVARERAMLGKIWVAGYGAVLIVLALFFVGGAIGNEPWSDSSWSGLALCGGLLIVGAADLIKSIEALNIHLLRPFYSNPKLTRGVTFVGWSLFLLSLAVDFFLRHLHSS